MILDFSFKDTPSLTHFAAVIIHQRESPIPWGTLYQGTYGSNWTLERPPLEHRVRNYQYGHEGQVARHLVHPRTYLGLGQKRPSESVALTIIEHPGEQIEHGYKNHGNPKQKPHRLPE